LEPATGAARQAAPPQPAPNAAEVATIQHMSVIPAIERSPAEQSAGVRSGLLVVGLALAVGTAIGLFSFVRYKHSVQTIEDLFTALVYFLEDHDGRFPASAEEFLKSEFVQKQPDGKISVQPRPTSRFRPHAYGVPMRLDDMGVPWGIRLEELKFEKLDRDGILRDSRGYDTFLIGEIASTHVRRRFTFDLLTVHCELRGVQMPIYERFPASAKAS
jgi:hypothetical protein